MRGSKAGWRKRGLRGLTALSVALTVTGGAAALARSFPLLGPAGAPAGAFPKPDRPVAEVISPIWASEKERDRVDEVGQVARGLEIAPGMTVADIGAGSGYYTVRLAKAVGPSGGVLAQDVTPDYLAKLARRVEKLGLKNVQLGLGAPHDPRLPPGLVDRAVLIHMYHEIAQPYGFLFNLAAAMKPGGRVGIVDLDRAPQNHGTPPTLLRCELAAVGYRETGWTTLRGDVGYLAVFEAPSAADRPPPDKIKPCHAPA